MEIGPEWRANKHVQLSMWVGHRGRGTFPISGAAELIFDAEKLWRKHTSNHEKYIVFP
jgi:hypothetical protein